jgi:hypothetical protein
LFCPVFGWSRYKTPVKGVYMVGAGVGALHARANERCCIPLQAWALPRFGSPKRLDSPVRYGLGSYYRINSNSQSPIGLRTMRPEWPRWRYR